MLYSGCQTKTDTYWPQVVLCKSGDVANWPNCSAIPHGQWVVVRSSRGNSPTSDKPLSKLDISNGSSIQGRKNAVPS
jgi:hypothetical protein